MHFVNIFLTFVKVLTLFSFVIFFVRGTQNRDLHFVMRSGHRLLNSPLYRRIYVVKKCIKLQCVMDCVNLATCVGASVNMKNGDCQLFDLHIYEADAQFEENFDWDHIESDEVYWDDWLLVFRAQKDVGMAVLSTWMNDTIYHDGPLSDLKPGCLLMNTSLPCDAHYKSRVITVWDTFGIKKVKVLLLKHNQVRQEVLFNGALTNKISWFAQDRVISSSWKDLKTTSAHIFSIPGDNENRHFHINQAYKGCPGDVYWMMVVDKGSFICYWDRQSSIPKFLYSSKNTCSRTGNNLSDFEYGDAMAILVK